MKRRRVWILMLLLLIVVGGAAYVGRELRRVKRFQVQVRAASRRYGVDPLLVDAVIWRESRFNPRAHGGRGEIGLMQVKELAAREWAGAERIAPFEHKQCYDPGTNTLAGTFYLCKLLKRYGATDNPVLYALADYNAGRGNVLKWTGAAAATNGTVFVDQIGFRTTRSYVKSVMRRYSLYRFLARLGWNV